MVLWLLQLRLLTVVTAATGCHWIRIVLTDQKRLVMSVVECCDAAAAAARTVCTSVVVAVGKVMRKEGCQCGNSRRKWLHILKTVAVRTT